MTWFVSLYNGDHPQRCFEQSLAWTCTCPRVCVWLRERGRDWEIPKITKTAEDEDWWSHNAHSLSSALKRDSHGWQHSSLSSHRCSCCRLKLLRADTVHHRQGVAEAVCQRGSPQTQQCSCWCASTWSRLVYIHVTGRCVGCRPGLYPIETGYLDCTGRCGGSALK
jgi:hypothetical protein